MSSTVDFDRIIDRSLTPSLKWLKYRGRDVIPAWVADMDVACPEPVLEAVRQRMEHPIIGYERPDAGLFEAIRDYLKRWHRWEVAEEAIVLLPGLVPALNWACRAVGSEGDAVMVPAPIYPPFLTAPGNQGRRCVRLGHSLGADGLWRMDLDRWQAATPADAGALLFCHPHNPLGRDWTAEELDGVLDYCERNELILISDEIHCQLRLHDDRLFVSPATRSAWARSHSITLLAPSKTYNIPGLACAYAVIEDADLRARFLRASAGCIPEITPFSLVAAEAAYRHGEAWRKELCHWLAGQRDHLAQAVAGWDRVHGCHLEATYLAWLDISELGFERPQAAFEEAGVGLHDGRQFGDGKFLRLNLATPRPVLDQILERMDACIRKA